MNIKKTLLVIFCFLLSLAVSYEKPIYLIANYTIPENFIDEIKQTLNTNEIIVFPENLFPISTDILAKKRGTFIFFNIPNKPLPLHMRSSIAVLLEPNSVLPYLYNHNFLKRFKKVFTFDDSLVRLHNYEKFYYPVYRKMEQGLPFKERKLICMLCGNKSSDTPGELYSERKKIIHYFSKYSGFELYGPGWPKSIKIYKGIADNKDSIVSSFKFNICLENTISHPGYITEKIFDSFKCSSIPIYAGPPNTDDYIPKDCYIDYFSFSSLDQLEEFINNFSEEDYEKMLLNIKIFMEGLEAKKFNYENFVNTISNAILNL